MRILSEDAKIDKHNLAEENERQASMYGYWAERLAQAKDAVKAGNVKLKKLRSEIRIEILKSRQQDVLGIATIPQYLQDYLNAKEEHAMESFNLEKAEAYARAQASILAIKTATGKEKDPAVKDVEARIKTDEKVIQHTERINELNGIIAQYEAKGYNNIIKKKEPTVQDIEAMIDLDQRVIDLTDDSLDAESMQTKYQSAVDTMDKRKSALDNLTTLWCRGYYQDPKGKGFTDEQRNNFQRNNQQ